MKYLKTLRKLLDKNLLDIILFGSFVKGGFARDIDVALVVNGTLGTGIKKELKNIFKKEPDTQIITLESLYSPIWLTLIKEGFSIRKGAFLSDIYKIKPRVLFKYSLKKLTNVQKVQFERGLKKTIGGEGITLTRSVVLVPVRMKNEIEDFLKKWGIYYESQEYELMPLLRKEEFL